MSVTLFQGLVARQVQTISEVYAVPNNRMGLVSDKSPDRQVCRIANGRVG